MVPARECGNGVREAARAVAGLVVRESSIDLDPEHRRGLAIQPDCGHRAFSVGGSGVVRPDTS